MRELKRKGRAAKTRKGTPPSRAKVAAKKQREDDPSRLLARRVAEVASDHKALDIEVLDLRTLTSFTDYFIVMSGASDRQVAAIADAIHLGLKEAGHVPLSEEGFRGGHWALIDYGDVVVHVFYSATREHYQLEKLWFDAPRVAFKGINA